jgi:hypothetical protein
MSIDNCNLTPMGDWIRGNRPPTDKGFYFGSPCNGKPEKKGEAFDQPLGVQPTP